MQTGWFRATVMLKPFILKYNFFLTWRLPGIAFILQIFMCMRKVQNIWKGFSYEILPGLSINLT